MSPYSPICLSCTYYLTISVMLGSLEAFILPASIYLKVMPANSPLYTPAKALLVTGIVVMVVVTVMTVVSLL